MVVGSSEAGLHPKNHLAMVLYETVARRSRTWMNSYWGISRSENAFTIIGLMEPMYTFICDVRYLNKSSLARHSIQPAST
jgi:hypothetical protein